MLWWFTAAPKPLKIQVFGGHPAPGVVQPYILGDTTRPGHVTCVQIGSKTAEKNSAQTNKQTNKRTDRQTNRQTDNYENNGHLAVNQLITHHDVSN